ncbi:hypothetical protein HPP92_011322 [Vanilla planifolia]|uniref:PUM-HD domain-containing protein n=1 Tax=Vanilla planifolia TaxID=51239 RepID=A0A835R403_VANPL|nr:hypothetical protein HPP92_011322 [Vanilla planifolia]
MATESPVRLVRSADTRNWPYSKDAATFPARGNVTTQEFGLLFEGHGFRGNHSLTAPSRSGSAPPSMEGSSIAIGYLRGSQNYGLDVIRENLNNTFENCQSEEQLRADPAYAVYYHSNVNLNPRLPPPLISQENRRVAHQIDGFGENWSVPSFEDSDKRKLLASRLPLTTHEEPEYFRPPLLEFDNGLPQNTLRSMPGQSTSTLNRHRSIVDLIKEDFPRTPSPVYNNKSSLLNHGLMEQTVDAGSCLKPPDDSAIDVGESVLKVPTSSAHLHACSPMTHSLGTKQHDHLAAVSVVCPSSSSSSDLCSLHLSQLETNYEDILGKGVLGVAGTGANNIDSKMKSLKISNDTHRSQNAMQNHQQISLPCRGSSFPVHLGQSNLTNHVKLNSSSVDHFSRGLSVPSIEVLPVLQPTEFVPSVYTAAAAFGAPYYTNFQPSNLFQPQIGIGGFSVNNSHVPPVLSGYSYNTIPMAFENFSSPNYNGRTSGGSSPGSVSPAYYGHLGVATQSSFTEPIYMSYFQHPYAHAYASAGQFDPMAASGSVFSGSPGFALQKGAQSIVYSSGQNSHILQNGVESPPNFKRFGTSSPDFYGSTPNVALFMHYPTSPLGSPVYPASPATYMGTSGRRNESNRSPGTSGRGGGTYAGWHGPRLRDKVDDSKSHSFLEELRTSKSRRYELSDIAGRILEFSSDQHGSRFIQQKLESCSIEEKASVFKEVLPHASTLMTDVFGNYVIQKFFEHGSPEQRKELANQLVGRILQLSLQMYGCRVIQKALEVIELDQKTQLVLELDGHVMRCVRDQNGNHVIQKCIECVPTEKIDFIISAFRGHVATLSMHPYGCRVIQRVLEHCNDELQSQCIVDEILLSACVLAQDQYGNYVTQHVLEKGKPFERSQIINKLSGQVVQMSQHKFASNVIEKCLEHGSSVERDVLVMEIVGQTEGNDNLLMMMKDQFANYVIQKTLEVCSDAQRELLITRIRCHLQALKKYTYGKHIVARVEQLCGEGEDIAASESSKIC